MTAQIVVDQRFENTPAKVIWKWQLPLRAEPQSIMVPVGSRLVHCEFVDLFATSEFLLWYEVIIDMTAKTSRVFQIWGTGDATIPKSAKHVHTGVMWNHDLRERRSTPQYVWHLYEFPSGAKVVDV